MSVVIIKQRHMGHIVHQKQFIAKKSHWAQVFLYQHFGKKNKRIIWERIDLFWRNLSSYLYFEAMHCSLKLLSIHGIVWWDRNRRKKLSHDTIFDQKRNVASSYGNWINVRYVRKKYILLTIFVSLFVYALCIYLWLCTF